MNPNTPQQPGRYNGSAAAKSVVATIEDHFEPSENDKNKLVRKVRMAETVKEQIEMALEAFGTNIVEDSHDAIIFLKAEDSKMCDLPTSFNKVTEQILSECSATDFPNFSSEQIRIQESVSTVKSAIEAIK